MYMQRILFILTAAVLSLLAGEAYAQRDLPGQTGIQFTTGGVNHFLLWKSGGERHYFTSLALHIPTVTVPIGCMAGLSDKGVHL